MSGHTLGSIEAKVDLVSEWRTAVVEVKRDAAQYFLQKASIPYFGCPYYWSMISDGFSTSVCKISFEISQSAKAVIFQKSKPIKVVKDEQVCEVALKSLIGKMQGSLIMLQRLISRRTVMI